MITVTKMPNLNIEIRPSAMELRNIGMDTRSHIKKRTRSGVDVNYQQFRPYSPLYEDYRRKIGKTTDIVNLENRSEMHNSLAVKVNANDAEIYYSDSHRAMVAFHHQNGLNRMPKREHFGLNDADSRKFLDKLANAVRTRVSQQWRN